MPNLQNYIFKASAELRVELMVSAPGDFDFLWNDSESGESRLDLVGESRQRMARFLRAYKARHDRLVYIVDLDGKPMMEVSELSGESLMLRLETIKEIVVRKKENGHVREL